MDSREPPNFDRLARVYRWMEWLSFGPYLWRTRAAFLPSMAHVRRALVLGDGDGRFTAALLQANPLVRVHALDVSGGMLKSLLQRAGKEAYRVQAEQQDLRLWTPGAGEEYDLVVTHFFLDCLTTEEVRGLARRTRPALGKDGRWVVSEFAIPEGAVGGWVARPLVALLYWAFGLMTRLEVRRLPDWRIAMTEAGFAPVDEKQLLRGLLTSQIWAIQGAAEGLRTSAFPS